MALIHEDGTGKLDAESYVSEGDYVAYAAKYGITISAVQATREQCLRKATDYMIATFRGSLQGYRKVRNQAVDFPRIDLWRDEYDEVSPNIVPPEVIACCCELAKVAETEDLFPSVVARGKKLVKIGPLQVEYDGQSPQAKSFARAVSRMAVFLTAGGVGGFKASLVRR